MCSCLPIQFLFDETKNWVMEWNFELLFAFQNEILLAWIILDESPPRLVATCSWGGPQACNFGFLTGPPTTPPWTRSLPYFIPGKVTHSGGRKHRPINVPWEKFRKHDIAYIAYVFTRGCRHKDNKGLTFHLDRSTPPPSFETYRRQWPELQPGRQGRRTAVDQSIGCLIQIVLSTTH